MVQFLVRLLTTGLESQENVAATKAQVVKALKAMQCSLKFGDAVGTCLFLSFQKYCTFQSLFVCSSQSFLDHSGPLLQANSPVSSWVSDRWSDDHVGTILICIKHTKIL